MYFLVFLLCFYWLAGKFPGAGDDQLCKSTNTTDSKAHVNKLTLTCYLSNISAHTNICVYAEMIDRCVQVSVFVTICHY